MKDYDKYKECSYLKYWDKLVYVGSSICAKL